MKKSLLSLIVLLSFSINAIDIKIVEDICRNNYKKAEECIDSLFNGSDENIIEGSLLGLFLSIKSKKTEDIESYCGIIEKIMNQKYLKKTNYWNNIIAE